MNRLHAVGKGGARRQAGTAGAQRIRTVHAHIVENVEPAVGLLAGKGNARKHPVVHQGEVGRAARLEAVIVARRYAERAAAVAIRFLRYQAYGAADGVLAEQRALRAAQHLDPFEVEQVEHGALRPADVDVVDIDGDAGLERQNVVAETHAANERGHGRAPTGAQGLNHGIRHEVADVRDIREVALLEAGRRDRRDRDGGGLQLLLSELRGDDDLFELIFI